jgi:SAM-dependent methyltransferase
VSRPCRLCGTHLCNTFADLGSSPLSNAFVSPQALGRPEAFYPLHAYVCSECLLVQLEQVETPDTIFEDYLYLSSYSKGWLEHARRYVDDMTARLDLTPDSLVIEVASNDGYLLKNFVAKGIGALGIEPAQNVADIASAAGIPTRVGFFGDEMGRTLVAEGYRANLVVANNVLAHVPDLNSFVAGLHHILKDDGVLTVEFPHLLQLMGKVQFDTIYHEHFSYFSLHTARQAFERHGLVVFDVDELPTHGGSLRVYAARESAGFEPTPRVACLLHTEERAGLHSLAAYQNFGERIDGVKASLVAFLDECRSNGKTVAGYGAPAKSTTLLNYCGVGVESIAFTVDRNPYKQGRFLPGTRIPIYAPDILIEKQPDYVIIFPWNLAAEIKAQMTDVEAWGGRFVVPIPRTAVLE